jgi:hypothetical protein
MRRYKTHELMGWTIQRDGGHDTPWTAWKAGEIRRRADTLEGVKELVRSFERATAQ